MPVPIPSVPDSPAPNSKPGSKPQESKTSGRKTARSRADGKIIDTNHPNGSIKEDRYLPGLGPQGELSPFQGAGPTPAPVEIDSHSSPQSQGVAHSDLSGETGVGSLIRNIKMLQSSSLSKFAIRMSTMFEMVRTYKREIWHLVGIVVLPSLAVSLLFIRIQWPGEIRERVSDHFLAILGTFGALVSTVFRKAIGGWLKDRARLLQKWYRGY